MYAIHLWGWMAFWLCRFVYDAFRILGNLADNDEAGCDTFNAPDGTHYGFCANAIKALRTCVLSL